MEKSNSSSDFSVSAKAGDEAGVLRSVEKEQKTSAPELAILERRINEFRTELEGITKQIARYQKYLANDQSQSALYSDFIKQFEKQKIQIEEKLSAVQTAYVEAQNALQNQPEGYQEQAKVPTPVEQQAKENQEQVVDLTNLIDEELVSRKKSLSEQLNKLQNELEGIDRQIARLRGIIKEYVTDLGPINAKKYIIAMEGSIKEHEERRVKVEKELSTAEVFYSKIITAIEQNPKAERILRIEALKSKIAAEQETVKFYEGVKAKNQHHLKRGLEEGENSPATVKYFTDAIENAERIITFTSARIQEMQDELFKLEHGNN